MPFWDLGLSHPMLPVRFLRVGPGECVLPSDLSLCSHALPTQCQLAVRKTCYPGTMAHATMCFVCDSKHTEEYPANLGPWPVLPHASCATTTNPRKHVLPLDFDPHSHMPPAWLQPALRNVMIPWDRGLHPEDTWTQDIC